MLKPLLTRFLRNPHPKSIRKIHTPQILSPPTQHLLTPTNPFIDITSHPSPLPPATSLVIYPKFLTPATQTLLTTQCDKKLRRLCRDGYLSAHFDGVIEGYKECSVSGWAPSPIPGTEDEEAVRKIIDRMQGVVEGVIGKSVKWVAPHVLDLRDGGSGIRAHVDNVQVSSPPILIIIVATG